MTPVSIQNNIEQNYLRSNILSFLVLDRNMI